MSAAFSLSAPGPVGAGPSHGRPCYDPGMRLSTKLLICAAAFFAVEGCSRAAQAPPPGELATRHEPGLIGASDRLPSSVGPVRIVPVHHGTLRLEFAETVVWIDPWSEAPLEGPAADVVLITDIHPDHYDPEGLAKVKKVGTQVVGPPVVAEKEPGAIALANGASADLGTFRVRALPAYNLERGPSPGKRYHAKGRGNGYLLEVGGKRIYVSGDTECTEEMRALEDIDVAFVSMNLPYTMPPSEAAACIRAFGPRIVYPYHYRGSDLGELEAALADRDDIELRIRDWY